MASLYLTDLFVKFGLDPKEIMLIRHSLNDKIFNACYSANENPKEMVQEYTRHQKKDFAKKAKYWMVFISDKGTMARLYSIYEVTGPAILSTREMAMKGFPEPNWYGKDYLHSLKETDIMSDLYGRLVIDWGKGTLSWRQWGTNEKEILGIQMAKKEFTGFDSIRLSFDELKEIVNDSVSFSAWHTALSSVYAIYLITDTVDGQMYVGSASSDNGGLLSRWTDYVKTKHGGNVRMREKLECFPERYHEFQFQILQILPTTMIKSEVDKTESMWKEKLLTRKFGMNDN